MTLRTHLLAALFPAMLGTAALAAPGDSRVLDVAMTRMPVDLISNVVFSQPSELGYEHLALKMDILRPKTPRPAPAIVFVTGGGFLHANKDRYLQQRMDLAEAGYVVASIEYRVAPLATFPAPIIDVKSAIRYLRANAARYHVDPSHVGVLGDSAGGYLAAMAGVSNGVKAFDQGENLDQSSDVQAAVDLYGLSDLTRVAEGFPENVRKLHASPSAPEAMWVNGPAVFGTGGDINTNADKTEAANPLHYVSHQAAPFLFMHGDQDTLVSPRQTELLHRALIAQGIDSTRYVVKGAQHAGDYWLQPAVTHVVVDWFDRHLKP
ncbi:alpha/beta hydrolase [Paludibacterium sp.]|uniref:alpha/beta hydrolase n=1 Tax=Paludibacterium sp. TaxID=1917523 RepID=UPI0025CF9C84|nr:alpha/beta hydrolase [Paludibacterium sp.]MBV8647309.1 alpha/beta hydrolase [Paludibacterium sp.]